MLAIGGARGKAFEVSAWEFAFSAVPAYEAKRYDEAKAVLLEGLELHPGKPSLLYDLACVEALMGDPTRRLSTCAVQSPIRSCASTRTRTRISIRCAPIRASAR